MSLLTLGKPVPQFALKNQSGELVKLSDFNGSKVVLYFYPKASTPGCTTQACGMRDIVAELANLNTQVVAVSPDAPSKLMKFKDKYTLNFNLLADEDHAVADAYGVWGLKKFMGREFMGIIRSTFIIDERGNLLHELEKINTKTHNDDVIAYIKGKS